MKFKGILSDRGLRALEKGLLPTLEKHGKTCHVLLAPDDVHILQSTLDADGMQIAARYARDVLFEPQSYNVQSRYKNFIAFQLEVALLLRVLKAAGANNAEQVEVKLALRAVQMPDAANPVSKPFLSFIGSGPDLYMVQDLPISKPYPPSEVERLVQEKDTAQLCPYYLDIQPEAARLQAIADKVKSISNTVTLVTTKHGHLHVQVTTTNIQLGTEIQNLDVLPADVGNAVPALQEKTPQLRLEEASALGAAISAVVQLKHFGRSLLSSQFVQPAQLLCGIGENRGYVHVMFVFRDPMGEGDFDDNITLSYKLPVRDD